MGATPRSRSGSTDPTLFAHACSVGRDLDQRGLAECGVQRARDAARAVDVVACANGLGERRDRQQDLLAARRLPVGGAAQRGRVPAEREHVLPLGERSATCERHAVREARVRGDLLDPRQLVVRGEPGLAREAAAVVARDARGVLRREPRRDGANLGGGRPPGCGGVRGCRAREGREGDEHERQGRGSSHTGDATGTNRSPSAAGARRRAALRAGEPTSRRVERGSPSTSSATTSDFRTRRPRTSTQSSPPHTDSTAARSNVPANTPSRPSRAISSASSSR